MIHSRGYNNTARRTVSPQTEKHPAPPTSITLLRKCLLTIAVLLNLHTVAAEPLLNTDTSRLPATELEIARLIFDHNMLSTWGPGRPWWAIDWPEAEQHFTDGVRRYTNINIAPDSRHIRLTDEALYDFPWLLVQQPGRWNLDIEEQEHLREYLLRGGFMMVDDFHGPQQWNVFNQIMEQVLPEFKVVDIPDSDELLHVLYELGQHTQIPGRRHLYSNGSEILVQMPHSPPPVSYTHLTLPTIYSV